MSVPTLRPLSTGEILDVGFGVYRSHFSTLVTIAVLLSGVPLVIFTAVFLQLMPSLLLNPAGLVLVIFLFALVYVVLTQLTMGASVLVVAEGYMGRKLGAGEAIQRTVGRLGLLVLTAILFSLVVGLGTLLIVFPGIILLCGLVLTSQVVMLEPIKGGTEAMGRAWALSRGSRGRIFLLLIVAIVLTIVVALGTSVLTAMLPGGEIASAEPGELPIWTLIIQQGVQVITNTIVAPLPYCILTVAYYDLRVRKEGFDLEILAARLQSG